MAIGLIWVHGSTRGMAGTPNGDGEQVRCPYCDEPALSLPGGLYKCNNDKCDNEDVFTEEEARLIKGKNERQK